MHQDHFSFSLKQVTKIEGHATLDVEVANGLVTQCRFAISDFKRFYTKAVENKPALAAPQMLSRICGTCSNSHIMSALKAVEMAMGIEVTESTKVRRELVNAGLYIRDHSLHLIVFVLPDVYNVDSILDFDEHDPLQRSMIENLFKLKSAGNKLANFSGGRAVHAPDMMVGGFNRPTDVTLIPSLITELQAVRPIAIQLAELFAKVNFTFERNEDYLALRGENHYDYIVSRTLKDNTGRLIPDTEYRNHLQHVAVPYSHASGYQFDGRDFMVGSLARLNLNADLLHANTKLDLAGILKLFPSNNVHYNNLAQAVETVDSIDRVIDLLSTGPFEHGPAVVPTQMTGTGIGIIEAPRGVLYHTADIENGIMKHHEAIVPTGQNQINIENDLKLLVQQIVDLPETEIQRECEKLIRAYDPCMSCASHFLKMKIKKV